MATLTIRNLSPEVVRSLKALARRHHRSMEQEVREILESQVGDRLSAVEQIERSWQPGPYLPDPVRLAHLVEVTVSNFVFGWLAGWILSPTRQAAVARAEASRAAC